ncbi:thyroglobulin [Arapaima gigas]
MAKRNLVSLACFVFCWFCLSEGKISDYQLESETLSACELLRADRAARQQDHVPQCLGDGRFRHVQCSRGGEECWCVNAEGVEIPGSRQKSSAIHCLTPCQLHRQKALLSQEDMTQVPLCSDFGEYQPVQCDRILGQCWCVDQNGEEIYGTRQNGELSRCPGSCEIQERRLLHGAGQGSPPQCSPEGGFLPVQCKFINTTDTRVVDLLQTFNRSPQLFQTFSGFRGLFPEISSYCFCADSLGREMPNTGVELLLDEVYDTAFSATKSGRSFSQSNMYRVLQRRFLALHLAISGKFRCPTKCEIDRSSSIQGGNVFIPVCDTDGTYRSKQCQPDGQCWCVDSSGNEVLGTRRQDGPLNCRTTAKDCSSERRQALSKVFLGPSDAFSPVETFSGTRTDRKTKHSPLSPCSPEVQELVAKSGLLHSVPHTEQFDMGGVLAEVIQGMFPTGALVLKALSLTTNPKRLQENLFGGKFLKNAGNFNFTGAVGSRGTFSLRQTFNQVGLMETGDDLAQLAKAFSPKTDSRPENIVLDQEIQDSFGRAINLKNNQNLIKLLGMTLQNEQFFTTMQDIIILSKAEDSTDLGLLFQSMFQSFQSGTCKQDSKVLYVPRCTDSGQYQEVQCQGPVCWCVNSRGLEVAGTRSVTQMPRCPTQCEREREGAVMLKASMSAGSELFIPKCEADGTFASLQCSGKNCFCMDSKGGKGSVITVGQTKQCPTDCQMAAAQQFLRVIWSLLSDSSATSQVSDVYVPRCDDDGKWHEVQCDGPPEEALQFYQEWVSLNNDGRSLPVPELIGTIQQYMSMPSAMASFQGFVKELFDAGHQRVFPALSSYTEFTDVPQRVLEGDPKIVIGPSVLLNPLALWQLLRSNATTFPGPFSVFSMPLAHFNLRQCWCVSKAGDMIPDTKAATNEIPYCPGPCSLVNRQVDQFVREAEEVLSISNSSHLPLGYGFLLAQGLSLTQEELQSHLTPGSSLVERLLKTSDSALLLAAHSTLQFYWSRHLAVAEAQRESLLLGYQPYQPQCDAHGHWLPTQCYHSSGQCWCVDEEGEYIAGSLTRTQLPQCPTMCQRARSQALISGWTPPVSDLHLQEVTSYNPSCEENGEFSVMQPEAPDSLAWCVSPVTGKAVQPASLGQSKDLQCPGWCKMLKAQAVAREAGIGYNPQCQAKGWLFSSMQCDQAECWCVSQGGQELPGTRMAQRDGNLPACDAPQCPYSFGDILPFYGAVLCGDLAEGGQQRQHCQLRCYQGYHSILPVNNFLCDVTTKTWVSDTPLPHACQRPGSLQVVESTVLLQLSLSQNQQPCSSQCPALRHSFLQDLRAQGLCSLQLISSGELNTVSICDESSVSLECVSNNRLKMMIIRRAQLSDLPVEALPDLHDIGAVFSRGRLTEGVVDLIQSASYKFIFLPETAVVLTSGPKFKCSQGYQRIPGVTGCVVCPSGTFFSGEVCSPCPQGSYQDQEGKDFCIKCPPGMSTAAHGAYRDTHCIPTCQRSTLKCNTGGDFQAAQQDTQTGKWMCVSHCGEQLLWTSSMEVLTEQECRVMEKFETVPRSQWVLEEDAVILSSETSEEGIENQTRKCVADCAKDDSCHHLALYMEGHQAQCEFYSADELNIKCEASGKSNGFLGNEEVDMYQSLNCSLKVKIRDREDLVVLSKKGYEFTIKAKKTFERQAFRKAVSGIYRTVVFAAEGSTLTDVHRFCLDACSRDSCCDGFILNQNIFNRGTIMCGLLSYPDVFMCSDADWDSAGSPGAMQACGAEVQYNKQRKQFFFNFGGQNFTITDTALPQTNKNKTDYQASIILFQRIYFWKDSDLATRPKSSAACLSSALEGTPATLVLEGVEEAFAALDSTAVLVDLARDVPSMQYRIFKHLYSAEQARLWCLKRCKDEEHCHLADVRDDGFLYFTCVLYPDSQVCGAYDKPLQQACSLVLPLTPQVAFTRRVTLGGSVKNFYSRVPFKKMVSYSVRSRVNVSSKPITKGFFECERRCDEDPCCRGIGYIRDSQSPGPDVLCLTLNSLGIQTCGEGERTSWRVMDCSPSKVETGVFPFGWYEKPVNQWTRNPHLCPPFQLTAPLQNVSMSDWELLDRTSVLTDQSISTHDVIHMSKDIAEDLDRSRDWCLSACMMSEACLLVAVDRRESAVRCTLYPDTHACTPVMGRHTCRVLVKEPAQYLYLRKGAKKEIRSVLIPGHGHLLGNSQVVSIGQQEKQVLHFLGVPFAGPPIGALRFSSPQSAEWKDIWNATFPRPSCVQPGDVESSLTSEDCLYLNIFIPSGIKANSSVLVFFYNPSRGPSGDGPAFLDGSYLAAVGDVIVVTASFRAAAFGFLSAGTLGNSGLQDQATALMWVHKNIAYFGGDPAKVTLGAERNGADIASLHLISPGTLGFFQRALLMGGSAFSPSSVTSRSKAQQQAVSLAQEVGCPASTPTQMLSCLRGVLAPSLNAAQTKLLSVSGPLQAWAPVLDGMSVKENPSSALQMGRFHHIDLMLGSSAEDGLISRAKNIKKFEELQGRVDGKTAFYEALSNSLGGDNANKLVKDAATWFYAMQHDPTPGGYSVFSRALENATRDLFIICPAVRMASFWATQTRSNVFMYHLPEKTAQSSVDLSMPLDLQFIFGVPHHLQTKDIFSAAERELSLQMMNYIANFIKSGNPNNPQPSSWVSFGEMLPPWPRFLPHSGGDNYKELALPLSSRKSLRRAECSFWHDFVPSLALSSDKLIHELSEEVSAPTVGPSASNNFPSAASAIKPRSEKDAYT